MTTVDLQGRRGGALILAVLVLVAISGLGMLAVTAAQLEVMAAGNLRTGKQARYLAEAGLIAVSQVIQADPMTFVRSVKEGDPTRIEWDAAYFGDNALFVTAAEAAADRSMGYDSRPIDFSVWVESAVDVPVCPGYSTSVGCCLKVGLVSEGRVGRFEEDDMPAADDGGARGRVRAEYALPYPCPR